MAKKKTKKRTKKRATARVPVGKEPQRDMTANLGVYAIKGGPGRPEGSKTKKIGGRAVGTPNGPCCFRSLKAIIGKHDKESKRLVREATDFLDILRIIRRDPEYLSLLAKDLKKRAIDNPVGWMIKMEPFYADMVQSLLGLETSPEKLELVPTDQLEEALLRLSVRMVQSASEAKLKAITGNGARVIPSEIIDA